MINELAHEVYERNKLKGFYDHERNIGEMLAMIHSEVSEALECDRKNKYCQLESMEDWELLACAPDDISFQQYFEETVKDTFEDELADIMIRVMDLAAYKGINLEIHIESKMRYNKLRPHKHGKKY